jgi:FHS family glucose/mannose:H+ symporter-like MFS transporter
LQHSRVSVDPVASRPSSSPDTIATEVSFRPFAFASTTTTYVLIGATSALYGPLLIRFSHRFNVSLPEAGIVLSVHFVGALFGVLLGWWAVKRWPGKVVLSSSLVLMAAGATGVALAHDWPTFLTFVFVIGLGFGGLDISLNTLLARTALKGRAHRLTLANAGYGLGAIIGPLLVILLHPKNFPVIFGGIAVVAVVLSTLNGGVHAPALRAEVHQRELATMKTERRPILITFIVAFTLYVAAETSTSGWIASQIHRTGYSSSLASLVTAGFWLGIALGRVAGGLLSRRVSEKTLVLGGLGLCVALGLVAYSTLAAPYAYPLLGLVMASVYPMGLIWYTLLCPHDSDGLSLMILFMMIGGVIGPGAQSLMVSLVGIHAVPLVIMAFSLLDVAVFASALRFRPLFELPSST